MRVVLATRPIETGVASSTSGPDLRSAYRTESLDLCRRAARTACLLWIAVSPVFVLVDFARFPDVALLFLAIRGLYVVANLGLLALLESRIGATRPREIAWLTTVVGGLLVFALMRFTGGHASPNMNVMGLLILGMASLMPWSVSWSVLASLSLVAIYGAYALVADPVADVRLFANNVLGFCAAGLIGAVGTIARERLRWREFKNRYAVERTYEEKCASEARLEREAEANRLLIEALEKANRVRSEFVSTMSHELRTPLNVMIGLAQMARDPECDAAQRDELLGRIDRAGGRLLELVEGTLEIGKLEAGRSRVEPRRVAVADLWSELRRACSDLLPRPEVVVEWLGEVPGGEIETDPRKLVVILRNLLGNALKFTDRGRVRVSLEDDEGDLLLCVEDTGIGIRPEEHELIFEMFRQGDGSETRRHEGSGLGLYIVRGLAQRLGGSIRLESEPGRGSTFYLTIPRSLPIAEEDAGADATRRRAA